MVIYKYKKENGHTSKDTELLIKKSCVDYFGKEFEIERNAYGKPFLKGSEYFVGVTHTDSVIYIAFNDCNFGIDCENKNRIVKHSEKIAEKYFSPEEIEYAGQSREKFLEIWVKKEAYIKFTGVGFKDIKKANTLKSSGFYEDFSDDENIIFGYFEKN